MVSFTRRPRFFRRCAIALITLKRPDTCADCGAELPAGAQAKYYGPGKLYGIGCHERTPAERKQNGRKASNSPQKETAVSNSTRDWVAWAKQVGRPTHLTTGQTTYHIDTKDVAVLIRHVLKERWPGTKFSVRIDRYAGGSSVDVRWDEGPPWNREIQAVLDHYQGSTFDGMQDLSMPLRHWLLPDGSVQLARKFADSGSGEISSPQPEGALLVDFGGKYVFAHGPYNPEEVRR